ncbi:Protein SUPPRESSOR OF QUENCHING 1 chloroplastic [Bienertia sinuspersici]
MAFRYRNLRRISNLLPRLLSGSGYQQCGEATNLASCLIPLVHTLERIDATGAWRDMHVSRYSTVAEISKEAPHEVDLIAYIRSTFDHVEGTTHRWINISERSKEFLNKDGAFLFVVGLFLDDPPGPQNDRVDMIGKLKLLQQRYPWLHVLGIQPCSSTYSTTDHDHLVNIIMEEYVSFPILLCTKIFSKMADGPCCMLMKGLKDPPLYKEKHIDLSILCEVINGLNEKADKNASNANKLNSTWSKHADGFKEPYACSFLQNLFLYHPACISADEPGSRIFLSDSNHHRVIVFNSDGMILDVIGSSPGFEDGDFETAKLMRPAASYYQPSEDCLYIVDSENHAIRRADIGRRVLETLYPTCNDKGKSGLWTWFLSKIGFKGDVGVKSVEFDSESLLFPWHLLKSKDDELFIMNKSFKTLWIMDMGSGRIHNSGKGHTDIVEHCGQQIMEKVTHLRDIPHDILQQLVYSSYPLGGISYSGFVSSSVALGDRLLICDTVAQRVLMMDKKADSLSSIEFSNFRTLALPYWLSFPLERAFSTGDVYGEAHVDHLQSFTLLPGKVDVHVTIDIPGNMELVEPLEESCVWRQVRGAAVEVLGMNSTASTLEKVGVAQQWYDELDNLAFEEEPEVSLVEKTPSERDLDDGKVHINCVVNTSPGTSEALILAPLYLKLQNRKTCNDAQEKAAAIADILEPNSSGKSSKDVFIRSLLNLNRDLGELVFVKPLRVKIRFEIINPPKTENSRDTIIDSDAATPTLFSRM